MWSHLILVLKSAKISFDPENPLPKIFPIEMIEDTSKDFIYKNVCQIQAKNENKFQKLRGKQITIYA